MKKLSKKVPLLFLVAIAMAFVVAGCGSSSTSTSHPDAAIVNTASGTTDATSSSAAPGNKLSLKLSEYSITPDVTVVKAGKVKVTAANNGAMPHEAVFLKTDTPAAKLKVASNGRVSESDSVGEVADIPGNKSKSGTLDLKPGKYVIVCNIPGHYQQGMYTALVVK